MSKKVLLFCASLIGTCMAGDDAANVEAVATQTEVAIPEVHELPGIRIDQGPVVIEPSYGCSEENIAELAHATVRALHATLCDVVATTSKGIELTAGESSTDVSGEVQPTSDVVATTAAGGVQDASVDSDNKVEKAKEEISEAVEAVGNVVEEVSEAVSAVGDVVANGTLMGDYVPAFINFITSYYNWFVEFFKQGWNYMVYNSVNKATRHIVLAVGHRSPVDLSALAQVNDLAVDCFSKMAEVKSAILAAAAEQSPQIKHAAELYLNRYEAWFKGSSDACIDDATTREMLDSLGVRNVDPSSFTARNIDHFKGFGGDIRHSNLFLIVSPGDVAKYEPVVFDEAPAQD